MSLTEWSETLPDDNGFAGDGDDEIVAAKAGIKERLELDHQFSGELDPLEGDCDGYHKKLTMKAQSSDPTPLTGAGVLYTKLVDDVVELFFKDETTGVVNQLTEQGVLSLNTLANDINANGNKIINRKVQKNECSHVLLDWLNGTRALEKKWLHVHADLILKYRAWNDSSSFGKLCMILAQTCDPDNLVWADNIGVWVKNCTNISIISMGSTTVASDTTSEVFVPKGVYVLGTGSYVGTSAIGLTIEIVAAFDNEATQLSDIWEVSDIE